MRRFWLLFAAIAVLLALVGGAMAQNETFTNFILGAPSGAPTNSDAIPCIENSATHQCSPSQLFGLITGGQVLTALKSVMSTEQFLVGQLNAIPIAETLGGDIQSVSPTGVVTLGKVNGVSYGASPATNTVAVVTGANTTTYTVVPNAALAHSTMTIAGHSIALGGTQTIACGDLSNSTAGCTAVAMTATVGGLVPTPPNDITKFLNGQGTFSVPESIQVIPVSTTGNNVANAATNYFFNTTTPNASQVAAQTPWSKAGTFTRLTMFTGSVPGGVASYAVTVQVAGSDTALTCTITAAVQACNFAANVSVAADALVNIKVIPAGVPTATTLNGTLAFQTP